MSTTRCLWRTLASTGALLLAACHPQSEGAADLASALDLTTSPDLALGLDLAQRRQRGVYLDRRDADLDVLFVMDNSATMGPKAMALAKSMGTFMTRLDQSGVNYQVGVTTTDVGSWVASGTPFATTFGTCNSFAGDDGELQRVACRNRAGGSQDATLACKTGCSDARFVPDGGAGFIRRINGVSNVPSAIVATGVDAGPAITFTCIGLVGDSGCEIEAPLEAARRALDGHNPRNAGFPSARSRIGIVLITDEDDCSVSLAGRRENDPATRDCASPDANASFDCFNPDYRCLARSTICNEELNSPGSKSGCTERASSYLEPVDSYVRFFSALRPADQIAVAGFYARTPVNEGGRFEVDYERAPATSSNLNRATDGRAACSSPQGARTYGRPQHRLSKFVRSFKSSLELDICDVGSGYYAAMSQIADKLIAGLPRLGAAQCLPFVPLPQDGRAAPDCVVGDVPEAQPEAQPAWTFPVCSRACCTAWSNSSVPTAGNPDIQSACAGESDDACYCAEAPAGNAAATGVCGTGAILGVIRKGGPGSGPPGTVVSFSCAAP